MKKKLVALTLDVNSLEENHEEVLEGLQPHANLTQLKICGYQGEVLPRWDD